MHILADESMEVRLKEKHSALCHKDFYLVQMEQERPDRLLQDSIGLDAALEVAPTGLPVVMLGWMPIHMYIDRMPNKWFAANGYPNVTFLLMLATSEEVLAAVEEVEAGTRQSDPLAIALLNLDQTNSAIRILHHDISSAQRDANRMVKWEKKAREVFGDKNQAELISLVAEAAQTRRVSGQLAGQKFPDVCIDVEGTILTADGQIRSEVIALAEEKARGGPITVWTGGDVSTLSAQLRKAGILYKIVSKETMCGAAVQVVIDNQPEATFKSEYGVDYGEYIQV